jgi:SulP family sulfate permease
VAIEVGMVMAAFLFMRKMALISNTEVMTDELQDQPEGEDDANAIQKKQVPKGVLVYEVNGPFFFGASANFMEALSVVSVKKPKVIILRMRHVPLIDATGLHVLKSEYKNARKNGTAFILSGVRPELFDLLDKAGVADLIGRENLVTDIDKALARAQEFLG